jgi:hypothetical protein
MAREQEDRMTKAALRAHPIAELVPDMTPDQYGALRDDIREHGLRTPTVMYEGMVLDGRNRARAWYDIQRQLGRALDRVQGHPGGSHRLRALPQHQAAAS